MQPHRLKKRISCQLCESSNRPLWLAILPGIWRRYALLRLAFR
jgi:hypothetical protein